MYRLYAVVISALIGLTACATTKVIETDNPNYGVCKQVLDGDVYVQGKQGGHGAIAYSAARNVCYSRFSHDAKVAGSNLSKDALADCNSAGNSDCIVYAEDQSVMLPRFVEKTVTTNGVTASDVAAVFLGAALGVSAARSGHAIAAAGGGAENTASTSAYHGPVTGQMPALAVASNNGAVGMGANGGVTFTVNRVGSKTYISRSDGTSATLQQIGGTTYGTESNGVTWTVRQIGKSYYGRNADGTTWITERYGNSMATSYSDGHSVTCNFLEGLVRCQ